MAITPARRLRRYYKEEEEWFPLLEVAGFRKLRNAFIKCQVPAQQATGIVFFLSDQIHLDRHQDGKSRSRYRSILASLDFDQVTDLCELTRIERADLETRSFPRYLNSVAA